MRHLLDSAIGAFGLVLAIVAYLTVCTLLGAGAVLLVAVVAF